MCAHAERQAAGEIAAPNCIQLRREFVRNGTFAEREEPVPVVNDVDRRLQPVIAQFGSGTSEEAGGMNGVTNPPHRARPAAVSA